MNYFKFNGYTSTTFGIRIQSKKIYSAPKYETSAISIPGLDGELLNPSGRFPNVNVSYTCYVPAKSIQELSDKLTAIKNWLFAVEDRYVDLTDSYDSKFKRKAICNNKLDITDESLKIGLFTITFSCLPFRYLLTGLNKVIVSAETFIENKTINLSSSEFSSLGTITSNMTIGDLIFYASSDKSILIKNEGVTYEGVRYNYCISFGGAGELNSRCIKFYVKKNSVLNFLCKATQARELVVVSESGTVLATLEVGTTASIVTYSHLENDENIYIYCSKYTLNLYRIDIVTTITPERTITLKNPYNFTSKPYIKLYGNGSGRLIIQNENGNKIWNFTNILDCVEVDAELMNFYKGTELKNNTVTGDSFPTLSKGNNIISFDGGVNKLEIIPRWICL